MQGNETFTSRKTDNQQWNGVVPGFLRRAYGVVAVRVRVRNTPGTGSLTARCWAFGTT